MAEGLGAEGGSEEAKPEGGKAHVQPAEDCSEDGTRDHLEEEEEERDDADREAVADEKYMEQQEAEQDNDEAKTGLSLEEEEEEEEWVEDGDEHAEEVQVGGEDDKDDEEGEEEATHDEEEVCEKEDGADNDGEEIAPGEGDDWEEEEEQGEEEWEEAAPDIHGRQAPSRSSQAGGRRQGRSQAEPEQWPAPARSAVLWKSRRAGCGGPSGAAEGAGSLPRAQDEDHDGGAGLLADFQTEIRRLEEENKLLRMEIGQEKYKVQQLSRLREQAALATRRETAARRDQAQAARELREAKEYVERRNDFARNEKAELLLRIQDLERLAKGVADREACLRSELQDALSERAAAAERIEDAKREMERWRREALEHAGKLKRADQRLQQLEQKRLDDKARIKALADQLRATISATSVETEAGPPQPASPRKDYLMRVSSPSPAAAKGAGAVRRGGSKPPKNGVKQRGGEAVAKAFGAAASGTAGPWWRRAVAQVVPSAAEPGGRATHVSQAPWLHRWTEWGLSVLRSGQAATMQASSGSAGTGSRRAPRSGKGFAEITRVEPAIPAAEEASWGAAKSSKDMASSRQQQILRVLVFFIVFLAAAKLCS